MHKFNYIDERLQTRIIEIMKQKQESHEKLAQSPIEKVENDQNDFFSIEKELKLVNKEST